MTYMHSGKLYEGKVQHVDRRIRKGKYWEMRRDRMLMTDTRVMKKEMKFIVSLL